jgi:hypothetical protein
VIVQQPLDPNPGLSRDMARPLRTFETVASETSAREAMSASVTRRPGVASGSGKALD